ncbi:MAG: CBS domain-containing protein [Anaerolineales bacterium]|nr:CBS domain-containing protein [Anaerolineales bacterium]
MLVNDCMTRHPVMVSPEVPAVEVEKIMAENHVRHIPVVGDGKRLVGLLTRQRLALKPDTMGSLNVWEISRFLSNLSVSDLMLKANQVQTITPDRTIERAAQIMMDYKIGCLPVLEDKVVVVGILSEVDVLRAFQEMLGLPAAGVRVTVRMPNQKGEFAKLTGAISQHGWGIMGIGSFPSPRRSGFYDMVLKIPDVTVDEVRAVLSQIPEQEIVDIREFA